ncbi:MAG: hypothetical protein MUC29_04155 [Pyrinomonadaceae bacterium]|nr:hypothetical protein [Pyrinomonadaceae bacterium]
MEFEFDKEIDAILRGVAKQPNFANSPTEHLDADEISMFAENVLLGDARLKAMSHLADCQRCRIILTNVVKLNSETEQEIVHTIANPIIETKQLSWFEKLFKVPNLAYTFGALTLVFAGFIGFSLLQNNQNNEFAKAINDETVKSKGTSGASSEGDSKEIESFNSNSAANVIANSATNTAISAANTVANATMPLADTSTSNSSVALNQKNTVSNSIATNSTTLNKPKDLREASKSLDKNEKIQAESEQKIEPLPTSQPKTESATNDSLKNAQDMAMGGERKSQDEERPETTRSATKTNKDAKTDLSALPSVSAPIQTPNMARKKSVENSSTNSQSVGGKSFRNINGVWTDSAYNGGSTKKVKRNSNDYKKLDSGLQNIGNSLSGTVIVVWNGKNYKIQ